MKTKKFTSLVVLLGLQEVVLKGSILGGKPTACFTEAELEKIESALKENDSSALSEKIQQLEQACQELKETCQAADTAVQKAMALNGLSAEENNSLSQNITRLGEQCKAYGEHAARHTFPKNDGKEKAENGLVEGYFDPKAAHNQSD